jgi:hypothetical protein
MSSVITAWAAVAATADAIARIGEVAARMTVQREARRTEAAADVGSATGAAVPTLGEALGGEGTTYPVEVSR